MGLVREHMEITMQDRDNVRELPQFKKKTGCQQASTYLTRGRKCCNAKSTSCTLLFLYSSLSRYKEQCLCGITLAQTIIQQAIWIIKLMTDSIMLYNLQEKEPMPQYNWIVLPKSSSIPRVSIVIVNSVVTDYLLTKFLRI